jgi:hypothetical protein
MDLKAVGVSPETFPEELLALVELAGLLPLTDGIEDFTNRGHIEGQRPRQCVPVWRRSRRGTRNAIRLLTIAED